MGYGAGIYAMIMASILQSAVYLPPSTLPVYYHLIPQFTFARALLHITNKCRVASCYQTLADFETIEGRFNVAILYVQALVFAVLAWYC